MSEETRWASQTGMIESDDQHRRDDVDHRRLVGPGQVAEDPQRQGLHAGAGGERRDDDLVERQREGQQRAGQQRRRGSPGTSRSRNVWNTPAPRSIDASSSEPPVRRSRASTLLKTTTMQNVACPTTTVNSPKLMPIGRACVVIALDSAMPVTMPGSAIGSTTRNEIASRPKKR